MKNGGYSAVVEAPNPDARRHPDRRVVLAMKNGSKLVVATQACAVDFAGRFSACDALPLEAF